MKTYAHKNIYTRIFIAAVFVIANIMAPRNSQISIKRIHKQIGVYFWSGILLSSKKEGTPDTDKRKNGIEVDMLCYSIVVG